MTRRKEGRRFEDSFESREGFSLTEKSEGEIEAKVSNVGEFVEVVLELIEISSLGCSSESQRETDVEGGELLLCVSTDLLG